MVSTPDVRHAKRSVEDLTEEGDYTDLTVTIRVTRNNDASHDGLTTADAMHDALQDAIETSFYSALYVPSTRDPHEEELESEAYEEDDEVEDEASFDVEVRDIV